MDTLSRTAFGLAASLFASGALLLSGCADGGDPAAAAPSVSVRVSPSNIIKGQSATLSWSSENTSACTATDSWSGTKTTSGVESTGALITAGSYSYTLTCTGAGGSASNSATLTVAVTPAPAVTISVNPSSIATGQGSTLTWSSANASSCTASNAWSGDVATTGSQNVSPGAAGSYTYALTCAGAGGSDGNSATLTVTPPPPPTLELHANTATTVINNQVTLNWSSTYASSCSASGAWSGARPTQGSGTVLVTSIGSHAYTLSCLGLDGGNVSQTATVAVLKATGAGAGPVAALVQGGDGGFYGVTSSGPEGQTGPNDGTSNSNGNGTIFRITAAGGFSLLHVLSVEEGSYPLSALVEGGDGAFYGSAPFGGSPVCAPGGCGALFKVTRTGEFTLLHSFSETGGSQPQAGLVQTSDGGFFGATTKYGGGSAQCAVANTGCGIVFAMTPTGEITQIHSFSWLDGRYPSASLIQGRDGAFYGSAYAGGDLSDGCAGGECGTLFRITASGDFAVLHTFSAADGKQPFIPLVQGSDGDLYGVVSYGGDASLTCASLGEGCGTVFKLNPGSREFVLLHTFAKGSDGGFPTGLIQASDGNFYGTTWYGRGGGNGTIFRLTPAGQFDTVYSFTAADGRTPTGALVQGTDGNFYGTTQNGGANGYGTIFRLAPPDPPTIDWTLTTLFSF